MLECSLLPGILNAVTTPTTTTKTTSTTTEDEVEGIMTIALPVVVLRRLVLFIKRPASGCCLPPVEVDHRHFSRVSQWSVALKAVRARRSRQSNHSDTRCALSRRPAAGINNCTDVDHGSSLARPAAPALNIQRVGVARYEYNVETRMTRASLLALIANNNNNNNNVGAVSRTFFFSVNILGRLRPRPRSPSLLKVKEG